MCRTQTLTYACNHSFYFRLSVCRGTFHLPQQAFQYPKAACYGMVGLTLYPSSKCGPCQTKDAEEQLLETVEAAQKMAAQDESVNLAAIAVRQSREMYAIETSFPKQQFRKLAEPGAGQKIEELGQSPLRLEVHFSDDEIDDEDGLAYYHNWNNWSDLPCLPGGTMDAEDEDDREETESSESDQDTRPWADSDESEKMSSVSTVPQQNIEEKSQQQHGLEGKENLDPVGEAAKAPQRCPSTPLSTQSRACGESDSLVERFRCLQSGFVMSS